MKIKFLLLLASLALSACETPVVVKPYDPNTHYDNVYIIMGQSNAVGVSPYSFLETKDPETYQRYINGNDSVLYSYDTYYRSSKEYQPMRFGFGHDDRFFGPEIGITDELLKLNETSYIVKAGLSGSTMQTEWVSKRGRKLKLYRRFIGFVLEQVEALKNQGKNPRIRGVFWMQGESDSFIYANDYEASLKHFVRYLRRDLNPYIYGYMNYVDAYISSLLPEMWPYPDVINKAKENVSKLDEHNYTIKTNGEDEEALNLSIKSVVGEDPEDKAHYDSLSMLALGRAAGKLLIK